MGRGRSLDLSNRGLFLAIGVAALVAGTALVVAMRAQPPAAQALPSLEAGSISPAAILALTFTDEAGRSRSLAEFSGKLLVLNFWATWCAPCKAEMPAFDRVSARWNGRGVQFVGLSAESPEVAAAFGRSLRIGYPLWTGPADAVPELSRRLGNSSAVLPHTVLLDRAGKVAEQRVGPYTEQDLEAALQRIAAKSS